MTKLEIVIRICKKTEGLTLNRFYKICEEYNLDSEQIKQAQDEINNRHQFYSYAYGGIK